MAEKTITSANAKYTLSVPSLALGPFVLGGFSADAMFTTEARETAITRMGVDGKFSAGFVPSPTPQTIVLQADSDSNAFFKAWLAAMKLTKEVAFAVGNIDMRSIGESYILTRGVLVGVVDVPPANRVLDPVAYQLQWGDVQGIPLAPVA